MIVDQGDVSTGWESGKPSNAVAGPVVAGDSRVLTRSQYSAWVASPSPSRGKKPEPTTTRGTVYAWSVPTYSQDVIDTANSNIASYTSQLNAQKSRLSTVKEAYEVQAVACGVFSDPFAFRTLRENDEATTYPQLQYFKYQDVDDLQFLTINDYNFVNNRNIRC